MKKNLIYLKNDIFRKIFRIMKISLFLFFVAVLQVFAVNNYAQNKKLSLSMEQATIEDVLQAIQDQSEFKFFYNDQLVDVTKKVNVMAKKEDIWHVLDQVLPEAGITYRVVGKQIALFSGAVNNKKLLQQQKVITGTVTDDKGSPLPGVNIIIKGTTQGTITDANGKYSLSVPSGATLVFSFVGFKSQEVAVENQRIINVAMKQTSIGVEEVVVTALGIKRAEKALGYSIQKVSGESVQKVPGVNVSTSLTGKVAGVLVQNPTDFDVDPTITIRGETNPLIVIDGIAYANKKISDLSAEDIESISVLKGATASALYGFRGERGAILITTKNGSEGKKGVSVDLTSNTMFTAGFLAIPEKQSVYGRGYNGNYDINRTYSWGPAMDGTIRTQWDPFLKDYRDYEYLPVGKDNFKNFINPGYVSNNNVNVGFRSDNVAVRSSLNWIQQKGVYPNAMLNKYTYSLGADVNLDKFHLTTNTSYTKNASPNKGSNGYTSYDVMYSLLIYSPADYNILDYKNNYWLIKDQKQNWTYPNGNVNNPYFDRYEKINKVSRDIYNADATADYEITDWLKVTARTGIDFYIDRGQIRVSQGSWNSTGNTAVPGIPYPWNGTKTGAYLTGRTQGFSINSDLLLTGSKKFVNDNLELEYLAGGTIYYRRDDNINGETTNGISIPGFYSLKASVNPARVGESTNAEQSNSMFGRLGLSWGSFIYVDATLRNDWVSMLANPIVPKSDWSYLYPSVSGSFVLSELLPESTKDWMDLLKVRSSWTQAKTAPAPYAINSVFSVKPGTWLDYNGASAPHTIYLNSYSPNNYATSEFGLQSILFKNRLSVDVSYFNKRIYNQLVKASRTPASGISSIYLNSNEERARRGWDAVVRVTPVKKQDLQLDLTFNWGTYKEIYTKIDSVNTRNVDKDWVKVGKRTDYMTIKDFEYQPGTGKMIWQNGLPLRSPVYTLYGYRLPDWQWGFSTALRYKGFSLFLSFDGVVGGLMSTRTESYMWQAGVHPESVTETRAQDVADPSTKHYIGDGVMVVSGSATFDVSGNILTDDREFAPNNVAVYYQDAVRRLHASSAWGGSPTPFDIYSRTFLKLREVSLTYTLPNDIVSKLGFVKGASISFIGQNVLFWAKDFKYSDPDGGHEDFSDPSVRYLGGNIKFSF